MDDTIQALKTIEEEARKRTSNPEHNAMIAVDSLKIRLMLSSNEDYLRILPILANLKVRDDINLLD